MIRFFVSIIHLLAVVACVFAEPADTGSTQSKQGEKKPNILLILADDFGTGDLGFFWKGLNTSKVDTPNIQKLAEEGVLFEDAHSSPLCAPSRYMVLSGNYPHRGTNPYGSWNLGKSQFILPEQKSIAQLLKEHDYDTAIFGKWHLGAKVPPNGKKSRKNVITHASHDWSMPLIQGPGDIGFKNSHITIAGIQEGPYAFFRNDMLTIDPISARSWDKGSYNMTYGTSMIKGQQFAEGDPDWDSTAYDMILVNETRDFIDKHLEEKPDKPFFAYVAFGAVHAPHSPPNVYIDGTPIKGEYKTEHLDMIYSVDKSVGSLVSMIEKKNLADDTIIIFTSDNGGLRESQKTGHMTSGPLRGYKGLLYEGGHRVPLIIRHDKTLPKSERRQELVGLNDLYATICDLVGIDKPEPPSAQDSMSFASYMKSGNGEEAKRKSLGSFRSGGKNQYWNHALREGDWKLVHFPNNNTTEMYNLKEDIGESNNRAGEEGIQEKIKNMYSKLREIGPCPHWGNDKFKKKCVKQGFEYPTAPPPNKDPNKCYRFESKSPCKSNRFCYWNGNKDECLPTPGSTPEPTPEPTPKPTPLACYDFTFKSPCKSHPFCYWNGRKDSCKPRLLPPTPQPTPGSTPEPTPEPAPKPTPLACYDFTFKSPCKSHPLCYWNGRQESCKPKK